MKQSINTNPETEKYIFIVNGMGGCGKDTFAEMLGEIVKVKKYSSIDEIKNIARLCGWHGGKTERDRKFLSDLKRLTTEYSDFAFRDLMTRVEWYRKDPFNKVMLIDIREPEEIKRACDAFGAKSILIENKNVPLIDSNDSDARVFDYEYDIVIPNNGSLDDLRSHVKTFAEMYIK